MFLRSLRPAVLGLLTLAVTTVGLAAPANPAGFVIRRGTNLSHWLSQDFGWSPRATFITEYDLRYLARAGFDHVRLPIDEKELWHADGRPNEAAFKLLLAALGWCHEVKLRVIVDLHTVNAHHFNAANEGLTNTLWTSPAAQDHFLGLWKELSARLQTYPVSEVAYEVMNEPVADDHEDWNRLIARTVAQIRATEPNRVIVLGSNRWQMPSTLPFLKVPAGDPNLILSLHTYSPMLFTHYGANWTPLKTYTGPVRYPGPVVEQAAYDALAATKHPGITDLIGNARDDWGPARILQEIEPAVRRARELGLQLYCGEFGCLPTVTRADRLAYYRDLLGVLEGQGVAWANWEYKGDFGIYQWHGERVLTGAPDVELIDTLLSRR